MGLSSSSLFQIGEGVFRQIKGGVSVRLVGGLGEVFGIFVRLVFVYSRGGGYCLYCL